MPQPPDSSPARAANEAPSVGASTRARIAWRILPFALLLYIVAFIDRVNVSYARLRMAEDLQFSDAVYGFGAGIFFIGYVLLEIPGTLIVERWSARLWISRIMLTWGVLAVLMGFIHTKTQFYGVRFLLGAAEAGFFPGIIVYLGHWFRSSDRARAIALFMIGIPISNIIGAPLSGWILEQVHWFGWPGWRWVFILEGIPAVILGLVVPFWMTDRPHQARWLSDTQRAWIDAELRREHTILAARQPVRYWSALRNPAVLLLTAAYFCSVTGLYGLNMWLPTVVKRASGLSTLQVTLVSVLPYLIALASMIVMSWSSDRSGERILHASLPLLLGGIALVGSVLTASRFMLSFALLSLAAATLHAYLPSFWALPTSFLSGPAAAVSVGLINSLGNVGGFTGPYVVGYISERTHSFLGGMLFLAFALVLSSALLFSLRWVVPRPK